MTSSIPWRFIQSVYLTSSDLMKNAGFQTSSHLFVDFLFCPLFNADKYLSSDSAFTRQACSSVLFLFYIWIFHLSKLSRGSIMSNIVFIGSVFTTLFNLKTLLEVYKTPKHKIWINILASTINISDGGDLFGCRRNGCKWLQAIRAEKPGDIWSSSTQQRCPCSWMSPSSVPGWNDCWQIWVCLGLNTICHSICKEEKRAKQFRLQEKTIKKTNIFIIIML